MKKSIAFAFCALFMFSLANAKVTVKQGKKTTKYKNGSVVTLDGAADTNVNYNGVKLFIPQGVSAVISQTANGSVIVSGDDFRGVKVYNYTVQATGASSFSVSPKTQAISVRSGSLQVADKAGKTTTVNAGYSLTSKPVASAADETVVPAFVADELAGSTVSQQATQNVAETESTLSPSAPR